MRTLPLVLAATSTLLVGTPAAAATRTYSVTGFEKIRVEGPYAVTLKVGRSGSAIATGDQRAIDRLKVEVQNRTLVIRTDHQAWGANDKGDSGRVALSVTTPSLTAAMLAGSGSIAIDRAKAQRFDLAVSGSGSASIGALETDRAYLSLVGTGDLAVAGKASQTRASLQGSGSIDGSKLAADDLDLAVTGSGNASFAARRTAKVSAAGSGDVLVAGTAACTVNSVGSGQVRCGR
jgi:hypothetical protein